MFDARKDKAAAWFKSLRDDICAEFEQLEREAPADLYGGAPATFEFEDWQRKVEKGGGGTGGMLAADEIVIDPDAPASSSESDEQVEAGVGEQMSDEELRSLWLRRVQTKPADFLRTKFAYQFAARETDGRAE